MGRFGERFGGGGNGDLSSVGDGISVDAGGDGWERNGFECVLVSEADRFAMTACKSFGLSVLAVAINRADGVDDVLGCETATAGDDGLAGGKTPDFGDDLFALGQDGKAAGAVDGAVDAPATEERRVRGVDDGVGGFTSDVGRAVEGNGFGVGEEEAHGD